MTRPPLATALVIAPLLFGLAGEAHGQLRTIVHASGFTVPVAFVADPIDPTIQYVVQQNGRIRTVRNGSVLATDFLDLTTVVSFGGEQGLLGMAFPPDHATSGRFFVNFSNLAGDTVVARFRKSADPFVADPASRFDLRWGGPTGPAFIDQSGGNHQGGHLAFGADGFLYIALGDSGSSGNAQNSSALLGKMLRIDVNVADSDPSGYGVPVDNPFLDGVPIAARPEIWSFGFRNPWRYSFDDPARGGNGALILADVGQGTWEEVDYEPAGRGGRNYGWPNREGAHDFAPSQTPAFLPLTDPIHEYNHSVGQSITGGYVYRGGALGMAYQGRYFFADFVQGRVWSFAIAIDGAGEGHPSNLVEHTAELGGTAQLGNISSFGVDAAGELYIVSYSRGMILKIAPSGTPVCTFTVSPTSVAFGSAGGTGSVFVTTGATCSWSPSSPASWISFGGGGGVGSGAFELTATPNLTGVVRSTTIAVADQTLLVTERAHDGRTLADFDGDGKRDVGVWRPSTGVWYVFKSSTNDGSFLSQAWGLSDLGDTPVPGDYDGDGKTDFAVWRSSTGVWYVFKSSTNDGSFLSQAWGLGALGDTPVPGDYDGDGKTDFAVWRPSTGVWYVYKSSTNDGSLLSQAWGLGSLGDTPVPGDYDGDGKTDFVVWRPSTGVWYVLKSSANDGSFLSQAWGLSSLGDMPVPGDYDVDGKTDFAVWRPSTGFWYILQSRTNYTMFETYPWGYSTDIPIVKRP